MNSRVQELFNELIERYNLRAITIEGETWYGINDLPLTNVRENLKELRESSNVGSTYVRDNTRTIKNSDVSSTYIRNFNKVNNRGETFGNFKMVNFLIMNSRLGAEYKIELIEILDKIRTKGYYIDDNITSEQVANLEREIEELKTELITDRVKKPYGATEIVKFINVKGLLSSSLFRYLAEVMGVGTYDKVNINRVFVANEDFTERAIKIGIARGGKGRDILFYKEFADRFNACEECLAKLHEINQEELAIKDRGIEKRKKNMPF